MLQNILDFHSKKFGLLQNLGWIATLNIIFFVMAYFFINGEISILNLFNNFQLSLLLFYTFLILIILVVGYEFLNKFNILKRLLKSKGHAKELSKNEVLNKGLHGMFNKSEDDIKDLNTPFIAGETKYIIIEHFTLFNKGNEVPICEENDNCSMKFVEVLKSSFFGLFSIEYYLLEVKISKASSNSIKVLFTRGLTIPLNLECIKIKVSKLVINDNCEIDTETESLLGRSISVILKNQNLSFKLSYLNKFNHVVYFDSIYAEKELKIIDDNENILEFDKDDSNLITVEVSNCNHIRICWSSQEISTIYIFIIAESNLGEVNSISATYHHVNINMSEYQKFFNNFSYGKSIIERASVCNSSDVNISYNKENKRLIVNRENQELIHWNNLINFRHINGYCLVGTYDNMALLSFNNKSDLQCTAYFISELIESRAKAFSSIGKILKDSAKLDIEKCETINVDKNYIIKSISALEKAIESKTDISVHFDNEDGKDKDQVTMEYFKMWNNLLFGNETGLFFPFSQNSKSYHFVPDEAEETELIRSMGGRIGAANFVGKYFGRIITHFYWKKEVYVPLDCLLSSALILHLLDQNPKNDCLKHDDTNSWNRIKTYVENDPKLIFDVDVIDPITQEYLYTKSLKDGDNKDYLDLLADWILNKSCENQIKAFKVGFKNTVCNLSEFSLNETTFIIEKILCSIYENGVQSSGASSLPIGSEKNLYPMLRINTPFDLTNSPLCFNKPNEKKGLSINVVAGLNMETSSISVSGSEVHIITDQEINALKLDDNHLKTAIKNKFINKSIVVASLHRSTQCDLHKQYNWPEVRVVYKASAEIIELTSEPVIIKEQTFKNNSKLNATFKVDINEALSNTCSSNWKTEGQLSIGQKFNYSISFLGNGGSGESSISYSQSFGIGGQHSRTFQIGSNTGIEIPLRPSESAKAILKSCKGFMKVRINFKVYLIGSAAVKFKSPYNNYDSWSININKVKCGEEIVKSTEDLEIGYYSNSCVEIVDNIS